MQNIPRAAIEAAIVHVDTRIAIDQTNARLHFDRAQFLEFLGRPDEALAAYTAALELAPEDSQTLNAVGLALLSKGDREMARGLLRAAIIHDPQHAAAYANLAFIEMSDGDTENARRLYEDALGRDPSLAIAHHGLAEIAERLGDTAAAARHRSLGLRLRPITIARYTGTGTPIRILALGTAAFGNIATSDFFNADLFSVASVVVDYVDDTVPLPPHDLIFNIIGEADRCGDELALAARIIERSDAPVLNHPSVVRETTRELNARRFHGLAGVVAPRVLRIDRITLRNNGAAGRLEAEGFVFPLLLRSPGYHTGEHFIKVESAGDVTAAVDALPGDELLVIEYLDSTDSLGNARKYRVMIVDGVIYPLHLAISRDWKVHYFSADMAEQSVNRAEDDAFLTDMAGTLGERAMTAVTHIRDALQLDYGGIDFGRDSRGNIVVYEANASMIVPTPDADPKWDYRRKPVALIHAAVRRMFIARARSVAG